MYQAGWTAVIVLLIFLIALLYRRIKNGTSNRHIFRRMERLEEMVIDIDVKVGVLEDKTGHKFNNKMHDFKLQINALKSIIDELKARAGEKTT